MDYHAISEDEKLLEEFPGLTKEELEAVNELYEPYLFYERDGQGRRVWTSCCHRRNEYIGPDMYLVTPEDRSVLYAKHGDGLRCPFCGREVTVKSIGTSRGCLCLSRYIPVAFFSASEDGETVYIQAYWSHKGYGRGDYAAKPLYMPTRVYRLRRGEVLQWDRDCYTEGMHQTADRFTGQPFTLNNDNPGYRIIGAECLEHSFLRYTQYGQWGERGWKSGLHTSLVRFLALAARYPESVEMLMKTGLREPISDWVYGRRKNSAVIKWGEQDPRRAFGLKKEELREFLSRDKKLETLYVLQALRKKGGKATVAEAMAAADQLHDYNIRARDVAAVCAVAGVKTEKLAGYLERWGIKFGYMENLAIKAALRTWWDYIGNAAKLGYDMTVPGVLMPRDLREAHDNAAALVQRQVEEEAAREQAERDAEVREKRRLRKIAFQKRINALQKKYGFRCGGYLIRAAESAEEIIAEGKALKHCVAGYADRYLSGATTILFLRRTSEADKPLVTIEMDGKKMVQAHGYRNEWEVCPENPKKRPPRERYAKIFDPWLAWVEAGSKRDKDGKPVIAKKKEGNVA